MSQVAFPGVDIPQPAFAFDTGGSTANVSNNYDSINTNLKIDLEPINERLEKIEAAILGKELRVDIDAVEMAVIVESGNKTLEIQDI